MAGRLTRVDVGAWLFMANPTSPEVRAALAGEITLDERCVRRSYRAALIEPGDAAVLWLSGSRGAPAPAGIWMTGHITSAAHADGAAGDGGGRLSVGVRLRLLERPVPRDVLSADRRTASIEVIRQPWMANPSYLTPAEWGAVGRLVDGSTG